MTGFKRQLTEPVRGALRAGVLVLILGLPRLGAGNDLPTTNVPALKASNSTPGPLPTTYEGPGPQPKVGASRETALGETWGDHSYMDCLANAATPMIARSTTLTLNSRPVPARIPLKTS